MVKILIYVPRRNMLDEYQEIVKQMEQQADIQIELIHIFGTPESLAEDYNAEILIARGMTYEQLKVFFPKKHLIELQMTSFDILNALISCKERFHPKRVALCLHNIELYDLNQLEELCEFQIDVYDVWDEISAKKAIAVAEKNGTEVYVGAGTVCGICDSQGLNRIHIMTKRESIESALKEAVDTARTINRERANYHVLSTIINGNEDAIITIDNKGQIQLINNQAYQTFSLPTTMRMEGKGIGFLIESLKWQYAIKKNLVTDEILKLNGIDHYVQYKPITVDSMNAGLMILVKSSDNITKEESKLRRSLGEKGLVAKYTFANIIGKSRSTQGNKQTASRYSKVDSNVLIIGETGTGKELFAHSIHNASRRCNEPFVALNCAALPENLLESELFGYVSGSFSGAAKGGKIGLFELAHKGTIFLDEIGEIPISLQAKLLRVLQEKEIRRIGADHVQPIDVRVISATNIEIEKQVEQGKFRADLYYRLNLLDLVISPLREREDDLLDIIDFYLTKFSCEMGHAIPRMTEGAVAMIKSYSWPGNVREVRNFCEKLIVMNDTEQITGTDLKQFKAFKQIDMAQFQPQNEDLDTLLRELRPKTKKSDLAKELGISRTTLWRKTKKMK
ncbi:MAG: sigma 54-interacting transcriptional regulator [Lachnospiraceae bacterium]